MQRKHNDKMVDDKVLIDLIKVTNSISKIYNELAGLDIMNKKYSENWFLQIEYLSLCQEYEEKFRKKE